MKAFEPVFSEVGVRPNDLDRLGHVNNAVALEYLEVARVDWLSKLGLELPLRAIPVVSRIEVDYLAPILLDRIEVESQLCSPHRFGDGIDFRAVMLQTIRRLSDRRELIRGRVTVVFLEPRTNALVSVQESLEALWNPEAALPVAS